MSTLIDHENRVIKAASDVDHDLAMLETESLCNYLRGNPDQTNDLNLTVLKALRSNRLFTALGQLCETINGMGHKDPLVRLYLAQSLIDSGSPSTAIDILSRLSARVDLSDENKIETRGITGRAYKDLFLQTGEQKTKRRTDLLNLAIDNYAAAYKISNEKNSWSGENLIALLAVARRAGIKTNEEYDSDATSKKLLLEIEKTPRKERSYWDWASMAVINLGLGDRDKASQFAASALEVEELDAFALNGTIRQLREVWGVDDKSSAGLLVPLQGRLLELTQGRIEMSVDDMKLARTIPDEQFEKILGAEGPRTRRWMQLFLDRGESVGQICKKLAGGVGTCFIVAGEDFHPSLSGEKLVLTNDHVVSPHPELYHSNPPLGIEKAEVLFEVFSEDNGETRIAAKEIVWSSHAQFHDACLIRLVSELPEELTVIPLTSFVPLVSEDSPEGVYIIGHPGGRSLAYSMQNNELLDHDCKPGDDAAHPRRIHYFTPTEPGSSGSPAMNSELEVIGLHHAGSAKMSKLNNNDGSYPANEAVWVQSIIEAVRSNLDEGKSRWGS